MSQDVGADYQLPWLQHRVPGLLTQWPSPSLMYGQFLKDAKSIAFASSTLWGHIFQAQTTFNKSRSPTDCLASRSACIRAFGRAYLFSKVPPEDWKFPITSNLFYWL